MTLTEENRITRRETCGSATFSVTNYTWTGLGSDTSKNKRLGHGTTEDTQLGEERKLCMFQDFR